MGILKYKDPVTGAWLKTGVNTIKNTPEGLGVYTKEQTDQLIEEKIGEIPQVEIDTEVVEGSQNAVSGGAVYEAFSTHNTDENAHEDIRNALATKASSDLSNISDDVFKSKIASSGNGWQKLYEQISSAEASSVTFELGDLSLGDYDEVHIDMFFKGANSSATYGRIYFKDNSDNDMINASSSTKFISIGTWLVSGALICGRVTWFKPLGFSDSDFSLTSASPYYLNLLGITDNDKGYTKLSGDIRMLRKIIITGQNDPMIASGATVSVWGLKR